MILQRFVRWCETAASGQRAEGHAILARALADDHLPPAEREAAVAALHLALDDPSPKVRMAVATELARADRAPRALMRGLLFDNAGIAALAAGSPSLADDDLLEALGVASEPVRAAIARRPRLSAAVAVAVAQFSGPDACRALAANADSAMPAGALRLMVERGGRDPVLRSLILDRRDVPADVRQTLVLEVAHALQHSFLVAGVLGTARASQATFESCARATAAMADRLEPREVPALVEHLRTSSQLTPAFLIRIACAGNIDLLAAALTRLSGLPERRVRAVVADGRPASFQALARECGLDAATALLIHLAVREWKAAATAAVPPDAADVSELVMRRVAAAFRRAHGQRLDGTATLLRQLEGESMREAAQARLGLLLAA